MHSLPAIEGAAPPRLARAVGLQMLALAGIALLCALPRARTAEDPPLPAPQPKKQERRIRIVRLPKPPPAPPAPAPPRAQPEPPKAVAKAPPPPAPARAPASRPAPQPALARIAADSTAVSGVRMRVLVPRSPADLAAHLRNSGGCLVVSRLEGGSAEVISTLSLAGGVAVDSGGPPCAGVPRLLRDPALNAALGDPIGRARAASPGDEVVLQVLLSPGLHETAQSALRARFGAVPEDEMGRMAAASGYELTCFAEPAGALRCE